MDLNKKAPHICCMCGAKAELKLDNGNWICWMCAQIQGELANL
jgi:ribosomal protein L37AE/L43A